MPRVTLALTALAFHFTWTVIWTVPPDGIVPRPKFPKAIDEVELVRWYVRLTLTESTEAVAAVTEPFARVNRSLILKFVSLKSAGVSVRSVAAGTVSVSVVSVVRGEDFTSSRPIAV